jgi:hypothetical protein
MAKSRQSFGQRPDWRDESLPPDCPFPNAAATWGELLAEPEDPEVAWERQIEEEHQAELRQRQRDRETEAKANEILKRLQRHRARVILSKAPRALIQPLPQLRDRGDDRPRQRPAGRRAAGARSGQDPGDPDLDHEPPRVLGGTAGTAL